MLRPTGLHIPTPFVCPYLFWHAATKSPTLHIGVESHSIIWLTSSVAVDEYSSCILKCSACCGQEYQSKFSFNTAWGPTYMYNFYYLSVLRFVLKLCFVACVESLFSAVPLVIISYFMFSIFSPFFRVFFLLSSSAVFIVLFFRCVPKRTMSFDKADLFLRVCILLETMLLQ